MMPVLVNVSAVADAGRTFAYRITSISTSSFRRKVAGSGNQFVVDLCVGKTAVCTDRKCMRQRVSGVQERDYSQFDEILADYFSDKSFELEATDRSRNFNNKKVDVTLVRMPLMLMPMPSMSYIRIQD